MFVALMIMAAVPGRHVSLVIYGLSFWHYYLYWLAYCFGGVALSVFKRDAVVMKVMSLVALGVAYLHAPANLQSMAAVVAGFLLNAAAAGALGVDRTYYGHEVAGLPRRHVTTFPYSVIGHPMLLGNIVAFGGTLINPDFRREWWPLATTHVAMNVALLFMEMGVKPQPRRDSSLMDGSRARRFALVDRLGVIGPSTVVGAGLGWVAGSWGPWGECALLGATVGASFSAYAAVVYVCYSFPASGDPP